MEAKEEEKMLTELGRRQAEATGRRLKELELPFTKMCVSTVVRARETADLGWNRKRDFFIKWEKLIYNAIFMGQIRLLICLAKESFCFWYNNTLSC